MDELVELVIVRPQLLDEHVLALGGAVDLLELVTWHLRDAPGRALGHAVPSANIIRYLDADNLEIIRIMIPVISQTQNFKIIIYKQ